MRRKKMGKSKSRRDFRKKTGVHKLNLMKPQSMRGGIRL